MDSVLGKLMDYKCRLPNTNTTVKYFGRDSFTVTVWYMEERVAMLDVNNTNSVIMLEVTNKDDSRVIEYDVDRKLGKRTLHKYIDDKIKVSGRYQKLLIKDRLTNFVK